MRNWSCVAFVVAFSGLLANGKVIELSDSDFDSELEKFDMALVMFYAPWCGHCKRLKPEFDKAGAELVANDPQVQLAKVDCTEAGKDVCSRFDVRGYPTLKIFRSGEVAGDYNGPREADGIVKHMKGQAGPASKEMTDDASFKKYLESAKDVVVAGNLDKEDAMEAFMKTAGKLRESTTFIHSKTTSGVREAGIRLHRPKHLHSKFEDAVVKYDGDLADKVALEKWIKTNYHGLVGHRTSDNSADFVDPLVVAYYGVDYTLNPKGTNYWRNRIMKVAKDFAEGKKISFAVSNRDEMQQEMSKHGLEGRGSDDKPVVVAKDASGKKYVMEGEFSVDTFKKFVEQFEAGKLEPYLKSEPVPESNDGPVKVAVAKNFDELVTDSGKDALVEFYAPWCGHCKSLAPIYDELGEKMKGEDVNIVKMDATANDVPKGFEVSGFPTIYWVERGGQDPVAYNGGRTIDELVSYVAKNAKNELNGYTRDGKEKKTEL